MKLIKLPFYYFDTVLHSLIHLMDRLIKRKC